MIQSGTGKRSEFEGASMSITIGLGTRTLTRAVTAIILGLIAQHATAQTIQGTAAYRERMAMPAGAVFEATLEDVSRVYAPASAIASTRLAAPGNPPIEFSIAYDPAKIVANNRYVVRARIAKDAKLLFTSDAAIPVITRGNPISVSIMLRRAADSQAVSPDPAGKKLSREPIGKQPSWWEDPLLPQKQIVKLTCCFSPHAACPDPMDVTGSPAATSCWEMRSRSARWPAPRSPCTIRL